MRAIKMPFVILMKVTFGMFLGHLRLRTVIRELQILFPVIDLLAREAGGGLSHQCPMKLFCLAVP